MDLVWEDILINGSLPVNPVVMVIPPDASENWKELLPPMVSAPVPTAIWSAAIVPAMPPDAAWKVAFPLPSFVRTWPVVAPDTAVSASIAA